MPDYYLVVDRCGGSFQTMLGGQEKDQKDVFHTSKKNWSYFLGLSDGFENWTGDRVEATTYAWPQELAKKAKNVLVDIRVKNGIPTAGYIDTEKIEEKIESHR